MELGQTARFLISDLLFRWDVWFVKGMEAAAQNQKCRSPQNQKVVVTLAIAIAVWLGSVGERRGAPDTRVVRLQPPHPPQRSSAWRAAEPLDDVSQFRGVPTFVDNDGTLAVQVVYEGNHREAKRS